MPAADLSIVDDVEIAISTGSAEKRLETIKRVTDLFLLSAGTFNDEQIELFDSVLDRLINTIELRVIADIGTRIALAEMSSQLAPIAQAPPSVVRRLANNDEIAIAGPVLTESARLSAEDLVEIANTKGEQHLLAISGRWWLKEIVTDVLLARRYPSVSRRVISNPGARVSAAGFAIVLTQAESDPELAVETGIRVDLPSAGADREMSRVHDFTAAKRLVALLNARGELNEAALFGFAKQRRYEETVAALAELSRSTIEVIRPLMQSLRDDGVLIPCKAAGLSWETVQAVLDSRFATGRMGPHELAKARDQFARLTTQNACRQLRFWQVRASS
jgi:uncharacterized protein (DUF2336 family)